MKKIFLLILGITLVYSCSTSTDSNGNTNTTVTDIDGNIYETVAICNKNWTTTNLNVSKYRNGDIIPQVTDASQWAALTTGAWCYYGNISLISYGKLYNWYAVIDPRGLAPVGYHIPSDAEWTSLTTCLGSEAGGALKDTGTIDWTSPNTGATNSSGFTGLPGGGRIFGGSFFYFGNGGDWWSTSEFNTTYAWGSHMDYSNVVLDRVSNFKTFGFSVRCIKD